jgi:hypothetical protein
MSSLGLEICRLRLTLPMAPIRRLHYSEAQARGRTAAQCYTGSGRKRSVLRTEPPGFRFGTFSDQPYVPLADSRAGQWPR